MNGNKNIKILVGLEIENDLKQRIKEYELIRQDNISRGEIRQNYFKGIVKIFNDTDVFDTRYKQEAFRIFLSKIKDGSLEIFLKMMISIIKAANFPELLLPALAIYPARD